MNPKVYRDIEIAKVIDNAFKQFKIVDPNEKADITNSILQQLDSTAPISSYQKDEYASSAVYRANVRNALIDIISQLLGIKDTQVELNKMEGISRSILDESKRKLTEMQQALIGFEDKIKESFTEGLDSGTHKNTIVKEDQLRIDFLDTQVSVESVTCEISPANSVYDNVVTTYSDNKESLFKTGIGSDVFHVKSTCNKKPGQYIAGKFYEGLIIEFVVSTESCVPRAISSKSSGSSNIALWEGYDESTSKWIVLGKDTTLGEHSYADTPLSSNSYKQYRIKMVFPDFTTNNKLYNYEALIHNIKIFKQDPAYLHGVEHGIFESKEYPTSKGFFKVDFDANYTGWATFRIRFNGRPDTVWSGDLEYGLKSNEYFVIPKNEYFFKYAGRYDPTLPALDGGIKLPLAPVVDINGDPTEMKCYDQSGVSLNNFYVSKLYQDETNNFVWILQIHDHSGMVYVEYRPAESTVDPHGGEFTGWGDAFKAHLNEAVLVDENGSADYIEQVDIHDKIEGFRFSVSSNVWDVFSNTYGRFTFMGDGQRIRDLDNETDDSGEVYPEEIFPDGTAISFSEDRMQYYYHEKVLYTNFNLLDWNNTSVTYYKMCDSISILIDLYDDAKVDDYYLDLISAPLKEAGTVDFIIDDPYVTNTNQDSDSGGGAG